MDDRASDEQLDALVNAFSGKLGGPLADLAQLIGEQLGVVRAPITHEVVEGRGTLRVGDDTVVAEMEPYRGPDGSITTLQQLDLLHRAGCARPGWGRRRAFAVDMPEQGWTYDFEGRNAIQSSWDDRLPRGRGLTVSRLAAPPLGGVPRPVLVGIGLSWAAAIAAEATGSAGALHHDSLLVGGPGFGPALLLFLLAWQVMIGAMMVPSSLPLVRMYSAATEGVADRGASMAAFLGGYALVWSAFGALAFAFDAGVHASVAASPWVEEPRLGDRAVGAAAGGRVPVLVAEGRVPEGVPAPGLVHAPALPARPGRRAGSSACATARSAWGAAGR